MLLHFAQVVSCCLVFRVQEVETMNGKRVFSTIALTLAGSTLCAGLVLLAGCPSETTTSSSPTVATRAISGALNGGQQPVENSTVTLYAAGLGIMGASVVATATTDANGQFIFPSFTCPSTPMYVVAEGGNPGFAPGTDNTAIHMMAALGDCSAMPSFVNINEVTTVAAAYALNGFIGGSGCVNCGAGLPGSVSNVHGKNPGLINAFSMAARLADVSLGTASPPLPSNAACALATPPANCGLVKRLSSLANSLAACINTTSAASAQCTELFDCATPGAIFSGGACTAGAGYTKASDTLQALLYIARNPAQVGIVGVYDVATKNVVFTPDLSAAPIDWTLSLNVTGGGLDGPVDIAIDADGHVWVANALNSGSISEFLPDGTAVSPGDGYPWFGIDSPVEIAIAADGHVWVTQYFYRILEYQPDGTTGGIGYLGDASVVYAPIAIAADGHVWVAGAGAFANVGDYLPSGSFVSSYTGGGLSSSPSGIAIDADGHVWIANNGN
ncbi:MAG: hypothetical protein L0H19_08910, partial [Salinisphaera sp.]|nr:hypothetical protein [Salinisphaera sp.]